jgi:hypothetical protein
MRNPSYTSLNLLSTCLSTTSAAKEVAKDAAKEKREQEQKSREGKKAGGRAAFEEKKAELREELENDFKVFDGLGKGKLLNLLKFYFEDKTPNKSKKTREDLVVLVQLALYERNKERDGTTNDGGIGGAVRTATAYQWKRKWKLNRQGYESKCNSYEMHCLHSIVFITASTGGKDGGSWLLMYFSLTYVNSYVDPSTYPTWRQISQVPPQRAWRGTTSFVP